MTDVFISYSHDTPEHAHRVLLLANQLNKNGIACEVDQYADPPPEGWPLWMMTRIREARFVLVVCSKAYYEKAERMAEGQGVAHQTLLMFQDIYERGSRNDKYIAVYFEEEDRRYIPSLLRPFSYYHVGDWNAYEQLLRRLSGTPRVRRPPRGTLPDLPVAEPEYLFDHVAEPSADAPPATADAPRASAGHEVVLLYSKADKGWADTVRKHFKPVEFLGLINKPQDLAQQCAGAHGEAGIRTMVQHARVVVILATPNLLSEDAVIHNTLPAVLDQRLKGGLTVFWLAVKPAAYDLAGLTHYVPANDMARPLSTLSEAEVDAVLVDVTRKLMNVLKADPPA